MRRIKNQESPWYHMNMRRIIVKEGPLVFIRNVLVMEVVAAIVHVCYLAPRELRRHIPEPRAFEIHTLRYPRDPLVLRLPTGPTSSRYLYRLRTSRDSRSLKKRSSKDPGLLFRHHQSVSLNTVTSVEIYSRL